MNTSQSKRKYNHQQNSYAEEAVDDLAFAASYAIVTTPDIKIPIESPGKKPTKSLNEKDRDGEAIATIQSKSQHGNEMREAKDSDSEQDSSDDESEAGLSEQLARMEKEDFPKKAQQNSRIIVPTTQNEVDLYNCPVAELEQKLDLDLGVSDILLFQPSDSGVMHAKITSDRIRLAGHIKFHMVSDRTIVVESCRESATNAMNNSHSSLLDEGSILLLKISKNDEIITKNQLGNIAVKDNEICVVPLGKILEVFGPVSNPLYTLRLTKTSGSKDRNEKPSTDSTKVGKDESPLSAEENVNTIKDINSKGSIGAKEEGAQLEGDVIKNNADNIENPDESKSGDNCPDTWSKDGVLTEWIKSNGNMQVYYSEDQVKMVDTLTVARNSRKGCDASNLYDEEVTDSKEMYFSDDEAEREAKRGRKKSQSDRGDQVRGREGARGKAYPPQFHHAPRQQQNFNQPQQPQPQPPYYPQPPTYQPPGIHAPQPPMHYHHQQQYQQNYPGHTTYPNVPPPPGPPMAPYQQHYGYAPMYNQNMYANQMSTGQIPPPPPPPPHAAHSQQYQQSQYSGQIPGQNQGNNNNPNPNNGDTVYYNYSAS